MRRVDGAKDLVEIIKEQTAKTLGILDKDEESWLKETRTWMETAFGKDESSSAGERSKENVDQPASLQDMNPISPGKKEVSLTDEERYQRIVKDGETRDARVEVNHLLKQHEQSHRSTDVEKIIEKKLDKEIDF